MADKEAVDTDGSPSLVARVWDSISKDGHLAAFARQGADELATALKAFPESISVDEPGTIWNPTQGEIAADRKPISPSEIARDRSPYVADHGQNDEIDMDR